MNFYKLILALCVFNLLSVMLIAQEIIIQTNDSSETVYMLSDSAIYTLIEQMPRFPGGDESRRKYLETNIKYPKYAREHNIQGRVYTTFVVEKDGSISEVRVLSGIGGGCDEEAVRVIENMPKWEPGIQKDEPVRVQFNMPIYFKLHNANTSTLKDYAYEKGVKLMESEFYEKAIKKFSKSINLKGLYFKESYANRGVCKFYTGDYEGAVDDIRKAISVGAQINKNAIALTYFNIANIYFENGDYNKAIEIYSSAILQNTDDGDIYFNRGVAYFYLGNKERACEDWQKAKTLGLENASEIIKEKCND